MRGGEGRRSYVTPAATCWLRERFKVHTKASPMRVPERGVPKVTKVTVYRTRERPRAYTRGKSSLSLLGEGDRMQCGGGYSGQRGVCPSTMLRMVPLPKLRLGRIGDVALGAVPFDRVEQMKSYIERLFGGRNSA